MTQLLSPVPNLQDVSRETTLSEVEVEEDGNYDDEAKAKDHDDLLSLSVCLFPSRAPPCLAPRGASRAR